jgi:hypothetical protein
MTSTIEINAPKSDVWQVLSDVESYHEWNPFFTQVEGQLVESQKLNVVAQAVGKKSQKFSPRLLEVQQNDHITWRGRLGVPGLFDGRHTFTLEETGSGTCRFRQHEDFKGLLVPFVGLSPYRAGWEKMNAALKARAEGLRSRAFGKLREDPRETATSPQK